MRNRRQTIEALKRMAERPGTKEEGETAQRLLDRMTAATPALKPFNPDDFPRGTLVFYNCWAYPQNDPCVVMAQPPKVIERKTWMRLKFNHLKMPRWVPVTSEKGCHISKTPLSEQEAEAMSGMRPGWR